MTSHSTTRMAYLPARSYTAITKAVGMFLLLALHFAFGVRQLGCKTPSTRDNFSRLRPRFRANSAHNSKADNLKLTSLSFMQHVFLLL